MIEEYNEQWITEIIDLTSLTKKVRQLLKLGKYKEAKRLLPKERVYEVPEDIMSRVGIR